MGYEPLSPHSPLSHDEIIDNAIIDTEIDFHSSPISSYEAEKYRNIRLGFIREEYLSKGIDIYFEAYLLNLGFDNLTLSQRNHIVNIAISTYPAAYNFLEDDRL
jgi:hypothetical protein